MNKLLTLINFADTKAMFEGHEWRRHVRFGIETLAAGRNVLFVVVVRRLWEWVGSSPIVHPNCWFQSSCSLPFQSSWDSATVASDQPLCPKCVHSGYLCLYLSILKPRLDFESIWRISGWRFNRRTLRFEKSTIDIEYFLCNLWSTNLFLVGLLLNMEKVSLLSDTPSDSFISNSQ